jgi:hypothetical protein
MPPMLSNPFTKISPPPKTSCMPACIGSAGGACFNSNNINNNLDMTTFIPWRLLFYFFFNHNFNPIIYADFVKPYYFFG